MGFSEGFSFGSDEVYIIYSNYKNKINIYDQLSVDTIYPYMVPEIIL